MSKTDKMDKKAVTKQQRRVRRVWMRQLLVLLSVIGPGLITANVDNDATGIAGYSLAGANYGYGLLWAVVLIYGCQRLTALHCIFYRRGIRLGTRRWT